MGRTIAMSIPRLLPGCDTFRLPLSPWETTPPMAAALFTADLPRTPLLPPSVRGSAFRLRHCQYLCSAPVHAAADG